MKNFCSIRFWQNSFETGMGTVMSFVLNSSAMFLLGAPLTPFTILQGWVGAFSPLQWPLTICSLVWTGQQQLLKIFQTKLLNTL